jgi:HD-like signal output (HDOD) protein/nitrogen-specific signal transduction histidine kinase
LLQIPAAILDSIESLHLPPIPQILLQFLHLAEDDRTTLNDLATLVGQDPSLSARMLTVANSPALCRGSESKNLTQCLVTLGTRLSRTLAACLVVQRVFSPTIDNQQYDFTGFWKHSLLLAETARALAAETNIADGDEAYLAGLTHDVGQLLLLGGVGKRYGALLTISDDETELRDAEQRVLQTDHAMVGAWLIDQWRLSSFMADAVLFHHSPPEAVITADPLSRIIWSAHTLCGAPISSESGQLPQTAEFATVNSILGIDVPALSALRQGCSERVALIAEALGIRESSTEKTFPTATTPLTASQPEERTLDPDHLLLEKTVRNMALMTPLQQDLVSVSSESDLLLAVRESARILFGLGRVAFLLVREESRTISGANIQGQHALLRQIEIPLDSDQCLAVTTLRGREPHSTFSRDLPTPASLVDVQITRILGSEGLLYVPLACREKELGVMAYGISAAQSARIQELLPWITSFAQVAADSLGKWREMRSQEQRIEATVAKRFERTARRALHEAGNPLGIIRNYLSIIRKKLPDHPELLQEMDILREEIDRVTTIVQSLSSPSEEPPATDSLDINNLIENMLTLYGDALFTERGIALEKSLDSAMKPISADRDSLKQILTNLWNNAADAMGAGDCFFIATHGDVSQNGRPYIEISMSDTGPGMPSDVMERIFQPLDPSRRPNHSGIGLSIVAGLVERLNGRITCQSRQGRGTTFSILLPQAWRNQT